MSRLAPRAALLGALFALAVAPCTAQAQLVDRISATPAEVVFLLTWSQPAEVQLTLGRPEAEGEGPAALLRFDQPLDGEAIVALQRRAGGLVRAMSYGYDSVLLRLDAGVGIEAGAADGAVRLRIWRQAGSVGPASSSPPTGTTAPAISPAALRLRRLKASLLWSMGEIWQAREQFEALRRLDPNDASLWRAVSQAEARLGRWREAVAYADEAARMQGQPRRAPLPLPTSTEAPRVQGVGRFDQQDRVVSRLGIELSGHHFLAEGLRADLGWTLARSSPDAGAPAALRTRGDGNAHAFRLGVRYDAASGSYVALAARPTTASFGAALTAARWDRHGTWELHGAWEEPTWTLPLLAAAGARRDGLTLHRTFRALAGLGRPLRGEVRAELSATLERWRAEADAAPGATLRDNADIAAQAALHYVSWRARPRIGVDYVLRHTERLGGAAAASDPLGPLVVRSHVHALTLTARFDLWRWLGVDANLGYALDLIGGGAGPTGTVQGGGGIGWTPPTGPLVELRYQRGVQGGAFAAASGALTLQAGMRF
ncbi:MAG: hypothetical protein H6747_14540 [Deltaproteobacteria bacterium]|nr:hypothetical protein [Deltaproteobacteria bacterium]